MRKGGWLFVLLLLCGCGETEVTIEDETPDVIVQHIYHVIEDTTPDVIIVEDTTPDIVYITEEDTTPDVIQEFYSDAADLPVMLWNSEGHVPMPTKLRQLNGGVAITTIADGDAIGVDQLASGDSMFIEWENLKKFLFMDPSIGYEDHVEWLEAITDNGWVATVNGAGAAADINTDPTSVRARVARLATGTTAGGYAVVDKGGAGAIILGDGETRFEASVLVQTLSDVTNRFAVNVGFGDQSNNNDETDGVYFRYLDTLHSGNWALCTADNTTRTQDDSGEAVVANTWVKLAAVVNAAGSSVEYFIDGISVGTVATNIPTGVAREFGMISKISKSIGVTTRRLYADYFSHRKLFTTPR